MAVMRRGVMALYLAVALVCTPDGCDQDPGDGVGDICLPSPTDAMCPFGTCWHPDPSTPTGGVCL